MLFINPRIVGEWKVKVDGLVMDLDNAQKVNKIVFDPICGQFLKVYEQDYLSSITKWMNVNFETRTPGTCHLSCSK